AEYRVDLHPLATANDCDADPVPRRGHADPGSEVAGALDRLAVERENHVARLQARLLGRTARGHARYQGAIGRAQPEGLGERLIEFLHRHPEARMTNLAGGQDLVANPDRDIDRDRERQALVAARARPDLRVDADHLSLAVEERPARVARVDRRAGLDEGHVAVSGQRAPRCTDDARTGALFEAVGGADCEDVVPDGQP